MPRAGGQPDWQGPRLPSSPAPPGHPDDIGDPAKGEPVARCLTCGVPGQSGNELMEFGLVLHARPAGRYRLCERCYLHANPPMPADPLHVEAA